MPRASEAAREILPFSRACRLVLRGKYAAAAVQFEKFRTIPPEAFGRSGKLESPSPKEHLELLDRVSEFLARYPSCAWGYVFLAFALRALMSFPESIAAMEKAASLEQSSAILHALLARMRFVHRYPPEGIRDLEQAVSLAPRCGWMRSWLGEARRLQRGFGAALKDLNAGIALDPWYGPAYTWRAAVWQALGKPRRALADLDQAIRLDPGNAWSYHQRMALRRQAGDGIGALKDANAAYRLNPKFGWINARPNDPKSAEAALASADKIIKRGRSPWAYAWRGWTFLQMGRNHEALIDLETAERRLRHPWVLAWKAQALSRLDRLDEAFSCIQRALRLDRRYAHAHAWKGEILYRLGRAKEAEASLSRALKIDPLCAWAFYWRAKARRDLKKVRESAADIEQALAIMPDYPEATALKAELAAGYPPIRPGADKVDKSAIWRRYLRRGRFDEAVKALTRLEMPADFFEVFFPDDDGRQDLEDPVIRRESLLRPHQAALHLARQSVLKALGPEAEEGEGAALVAYCDLLIGDYAAAAARAQKAVETAEPCFWTHFLHAVCLRLKGARDRTRHILPRVLEAINRAIALEPENIHGYLVRVNVFREFEDQAGRLADAERVLKLRPRHSWATVERSELLSETGRPKEALEALGELVRRKPKAAWAWAHLGRVRGICGDARGAFKDLEKAIALDPSCGGVYAWRGEAKRRLGDYRGALGDFSASIRADPRYRLSYSWRGRVQLLLGRYPEAVQDLSRALDFEPLEEFAAAWRAEAWWKMGECEKAALGFDALLPAEPTLSWNRRVEEGQRQELGFRIGKHEELTRRREGFWTDLKEVVARRRDDPWAWAFLGRCRVTQGDATQGLEDLSRALKLRELAYARRWRGEGRRRAGDLEAAGKDLDAALRLAPQDRWARAYRALQRAAAGEHEAAEQDFEAALALGGHRFSVVHLWRGEWHYSLGNLERARADFEAARLLDGKDDRAGAWLKRLEPEGVPA